MGRELLRYKPFPVNVAVIRGSFADAHGNISLDQEPANVDIYAAALAAHNSGGKVIVQVRTAVEVGALPARSVRVPGARSSMRSWSIRCSRWATTWSTTRPCRARSRDRRARRRAAAVHGPPADRPPRRRGAARRRRAQLRLRHSGRRRQARSPSAAHLDRYYQTIEHGTYGGELLEGTLFGYARNATAMIDGPSQFDFYSGGGLDIAFLGFGEIDAVRQRQRLQARRRDGRARRLHRHRARTPRRWCSAAPSTPRARSSRSARGASPSSATARSASSSRQVEQITYSGREALRRAQEVVYVTERAVFRLTDQGVTLIEVAPGVDVQTRRAGRACSSRRSSPRDPALDGCAALQRITGERHGAGAHCGDRAGLIGRTHIGCCARAIPTTRWPPSPTHRPAAAEEAKQLGYPILCRRSRRCSISVKPDGAIVAVPNQMHVKVGLGLHRPQGPDHHREADRRRSWRQRSSWSRPRERQAWRSMVGHHRRHNPIMRKAAEIIASGGIGPRGRRQRPVAQPQARSPTFDIDLAQGGRAAGRC